HLGPVVQISREERADEDAPGLGAARQPSIRRGGRHSSGSWPSSCRRVVPPEKIWAILLYNAIDRPSRTRLKLGPQHADESWDSSLEDVSRERHRARHAKMIDRLAGNTTPVSFLAATLGRSEAP